MGKKNKGGGGNTTANGYVLCSTAKFSVLEPPGSNCSPESGAETKASTKGKSNTSKSPKQGPSKQARPEVDEQLSMQIEKLLLGALKDSPEIADTWEFAAAHALPHEAVVGKLKSLEADQMLCAEPLSLAYFTLTAEAAGVAAEGSPEVRLFRAVPPGGAELAQVEAAVGAAAARVGMGPCMKNRWLRKDGTRLVPLVAAVEDSTQEVLRRLQAADLRAQGLGKEDEKNLKRRKLIAQVTRKSFRVTPGPEWATERVERVGDLTKEMLDSGAWKTAVFKAQNFQTLGAPVEGGYLHPLLKVRAEFRKILMGMGFAEMPTSKWVEGCFWNFDALFQPQSHPARDAHDTFFIKEPACTNSVPEDYYERVREVHEKGGYGSVGYGCNFKREEAMKNILRTHTTAVSSQMLYKMAQEYQAEGKFTPKKYFSIDRVFRNESMDATHLCEFHQVEGLVADRNLSLANLIGVIKTFFAQIGITNLRFKPAYNPYTEPSMEIFGYHPDLKCWTEIGNSGMFRPEMLRPMGLPDDVRVIAWGLSLERPTMIKYNVTNIRDLFGHKVDLGRTKMAPICRF
mmetsp:Transcript_22505/g.36014  ORF Transcript_22505/g.36014 Transcript_22505/m.36014 type:complete len:570 (-) Transcript_22505:299-2008(-)